MAGDLTDDEVARFGRDGALVLRGFADAGTVARIRARAEADLAAEAGPVEFEAQVGYPGAPASIAAEGGRTVRRLLQAFDRDPAIAGFAASPRLARVLERLLGGRPVLSRAHHNCVMTKHPDFGSETGWHRDIRYWAFERPELVSAWLALGPERPDNGGLWLIPGTQAVEIGGDRLDGKAFLRTDHPENAPLLDARVAAELEAGDVLLFHCRTFHAAGRNASGAVKLSAVFTYRAETNPPIPGTRSASLPEVPLEA